MKFSIHFVVSSSLLDQKELLILPHKHYNLYAERPGNMAGPLWIPATTVKLSNMPKNHAVPWLKTTGSFVFFENKRNCRILVVHIFHH